MKPSLSLFLCCCLVLLTSCGLQDDIKNATEEKHQKAYDHGYQWAKNHAIRDQDSCARFMNFASKSPELEGCIDYHREYSEKRQALEDNSHNFNEDGAAPIAPVEENISADEPCDALNEFCTN